MNKHFLEEFIFIGKCVTNERDRRPKFSVRYLKIKHFAERHVIAARNQTGLILLTYLVLIFLNKLPLSRSNFFLILW